MRKYLFVGGPADGQWLNVPDGMEIYKVPNDYKPKYPKPYEILKDYDTNPFTITYCEYSKEYLISKEGALHPLFMLADSGFDLIVRLIQGYRRP